MKELKFSFFYSPNGITNTKPKKEISLIELFEILQSDYLKTLTEAIREATDTELQKKLKNKLPYITPYGTFEERTNSKILTYNSNLIALDFDNLNTFQISYIRSRLIESGRTYYVGTSSRGKGIKALIFAGCNFDSENHYESLKHNKESILEYVGIEREELDLRMFVLSQPFFLNYDEKAYFNLNPLTLIEEKERLRPYKKESPIYNRITPLIEVTEEGKNRIDKYLKGCYELLVSKYQTIKEGNRHNSIAMIRSFASYLRTYQPGKESYYKERLYVYISSMYSEEERRISRVQESFNTAWSEIQFGHCQAIENINNEVLRLKELVNCFLNGLECEYIGKDYKGRETVDKIELTKNGIKWTLNGYSLAYRDLEEDYFTIKILGHTTPEKVERLNLLPNIKIIQFQEITVLNGKEWNGKETVINSQSVAI
jgi:hypothetical protein